MPEEIMADDPTAALAQANREDAQFGEGIDAEQYEEDDLQAEGEEYGEETEEVEIPDELDPDEVDASEFSGMTPDQLQAVHAAMLKGMNKKFREAAEQSRVAAELKAKAEAFDKIQNGQASEAGQQDQQASIFSNPFNVEENDRLAEDIVPGVRFEAAEAVKQMLEKPLSVYGKAIEQVYGWMQSQINTQVSSQFENADEVKEAAAEVFKKANGALTLEQAYRAVGGRAADNGAAGVKKKTLAKRREKRPLTRGTSNRTVSAPSGKMSAADIEKMFAEAGQPIR